MRSLPNIGRRASKATDGYQFSTFALGTTISPRLSDSEDALRAEFKLRGGETIKSEITKEVARIISRQTGSPRSFKNPDLTILIDPLLGSTQVTPSSLFISGRYTKRQRGISQKRSKCKDCDSGCPTCDYSGFSKSPSVEGEIGGYLLGKFHGSKVIMTWIGGEDPNSLVLGMGRPFFAEVQRPMKRWPITRAKNVRNGVRILGIRVLKRPPSSSPKFRLSIRAAISVVGSIPDDVSSRLGEFFRHKEVTAYSPNKRRYFRKIVYSLKTSNVRDDRFTAKIDCDGGLNIKRFISGERGEVSPSVSEALMVQCSTMKEKPFDVLSVILQKSVLPSKTGIQEKTILPAPH
jgi:tRNA pseudouridine synthase 10